MGGREGCRVGPSAAARDAATWHPAHGVHLQPPPKPKTAENLFLLNCKVFQPDARRDALSVCRCAIRPSICCTRAAW